MKIDKVILISLIVIMFINFLDLTITIIGIKFYSIQEANPLHKFFFSLGNIGYLISYIFNFVYIFFVLIFLDKISPCIYKKIDKREYDKSLRIRTFIIATLTFIIMEILVIIHSIIIIW